MTDEHMSHETHHKDNSGSNSNVMNMVMVGMLVAAAFIVGNLWQKVQKLESGAKNVAVSPAPAAGQEPSAADMAEQLKNVPEVDDKDWMTGDKNAELTLVEYSDFECPFCSRFHPTMEKVMTEYKGKVRWVYRHFPLPFHASAQMLAEASECVGELGGNDAFWKYASAVYSKSITQKADLEKEIKALGYDTAKVMKCVDSAKYADKIKAQMEAGQKAGIGGTPGTVIISKDGQRELIPGALPYEQVKPMLDKYLK